MRMLRWAIFLGTVICSTPTYAARCGGDFNTFVAAMSQEAAAAGVSQGVISQALSGVTQDPAVLAFDRRQRGTFNKTFEQYVSTRVGPGRINMGRQMLQRHASLLARVEQKFGVPPEIIVAIWGLESDYGKGDIGKMPVIRTLATMAHDCRRTELFQGELLAALKIVQRGDLPLRDLIGAFAGEIGQTQFLPSSYINTASISTATATSTSATACPTCSPPPRTCCMCQASRTARRTARAPPISKPCASGTGRRSTARRSGILPTG
jgi:membrane-bound lytic murein transglycosylase B